MIYVEIYCIIKRTDLCWQAYKDPMHAYDHGVAMHIITAVVRTLHKLEIDLGLPKNTLVKKLTARVYNMCSSIDSKHETLLLFSHQSIVTLFEALSTPNKKGQKQAPIVDATDVQKLMMALPFLLDDLAQEDLHWFNSDKAAGGRVKDPMPAAIMAINEWLHWYHLYRKEEPNEGDVANLTLMGHSLFKTLQTTFPFFVKHGGKKLPVPGKQEQPNQMRSMWCNEKVHSILHAPRNLMLMGRSKNINCQVTETRHKGIKIKAIKSNRKPGTMGFSVMSQEVKDSALQNLAQSMDQYGPTWKPRTAKRRRIQVAQADPHLDVDSESDLDSESSESESDSDLDHAEDPGLSAEQESVSMSRTLKAMRYYARDAEAIDSTAQERVSRKTAGCMGTGLRCNIWDRAHSVENMRHELIKGWSHAPGSRKGNLGLLMQDINWSESSNGTKPAILDQVPCLGFLSCKVVHYLVDYHPEWLDELDLPPTNGKHSQLEKHHFQSVLKRLQWMPEVKKHLQLYSAVKINHDLAGFQGFQTIHACPFYCASPREVCAFCNTL